MRFRRSRWTVLTAAVLATAVLFFALSVQEGTRRDLRELLERWGADVLFVTVIEFRYSDTGSIDSSIVHPVTTDTLELLEADPAIEEVAVMGGGSRFSRPGDSYSIRWREVNPSFANVVSLPLASGRRFGPSDDRVAVLGAEVREVVFGDVDPVGQRIRDVEIVGVLERIPAEYVVFEYLNRQVLVPFSNPEGSKWGTLPDTVSLCVKASGSLADAERAIVAQIPKATVRRHADRLGRSFSRLRVVNRVLLVSGLATALTATLLVGGLLALSALPSRLLLKVPSTCRYGICSCQLAQPSWGFSPRLCRR